MHDRNDSNNSANNMGLVKVITTGSRHTSQPQTDKFQISFIISQTKECLYNHEYIIEED